MDARRVAVVGAGLAGLRATDRLADAHEVTVFEAESTVGGRVRTRREGPYRFDRGFQVLFTSYPELRDAVPLEQLDLRAFPPGAVVCRPNHRATVADPLRDPANAVETAFSRDLTIGDKLRVLGLARDLRGTSPEAIRHHDDRTIEAYLSERGFSRRFVEHFAAPFFGGITLDRSLQTSSRVFEFVFSMLATGRAAVPADGMGALPALLVGQAREKGARIQTETPVESVRATDGGAELVTAERTHTVDAVVVAADPPTSARLTGVGAIPTTGRACVTQYLRLPASSPLADQAHIHLNAGGKIPNQIAVLSAVAPEYAPDDEALLAATTLGDREESDDELFETAQGVLRQWYPEASFEALDLLHTERCPFAQFDQPPGVADRLPDVRAPDGAVYLAGDYTRGSSINGALESGRLAAEAVLDDLTRERPR
ncbi:MAG: NAD(P)/FAD-dependent oxidoreductase [Halanaeroarchaeum sp.]